jgi:hypothetical protein
MTILAMDAARVREAVKAGLAKQIIAQLARYGVSFDPRIGAVGFLAADTAEIDASAKWDGLSIVACDAQPELVTAPNASIPSWLTQYFDPSIINILTSPMRATEIVGSEEKKGDWTTTHATFLSVELTGETSAYGDFNNNGSSNANINFPQRQSFLYQTFTNWGELQLARAGNARVDWANKVNQASILVLNKFQNATYFFGVAGIPNYGLLNDPGLRPSIVAANVWNASATTGDQVYEDIRRMFVQLQNQSNGVIDDQSPMTLAMSPVLAVALNKTNSFNVNVKAQLRENFPNLTVKTAVEYQTASGQLVQLICNEVQGQKTATTAFTEKMRAHAVVVGSSSWSQKKSQGTFGTVIFNEFAIASLIGA